jgi:hypothetical protein
VTIVINSALRIGGGGGGDENEMKRRQRSRRECDLSHSLQDYIPDGLQAALHSARTTKRVHACRTIVCSSGARGADTPPPPPILGGGAACRTAASHEAAAGHAPGCASV